MPPITSNLLTAFAIVPEVCSRDADDLSASCQLRHLPSHSNVDNIPRQFRATDRSIYIGTKQKL